MPGLCLVGSVTEPKISICLFLLFISTLSVASRLAIALTFLFGKNFR